MLRSIEIIDMILANISIFLWRFISLIMDSIVITIDYLLVFFRYLSIPCAIPFDRSC
jgi:hypothetical protein